jgi:hypothetical protein
LQIHERLLADADEALATVREIEDEQDDDGDERREQQIGKG